jgi:hypothetical protein
MIQQRTGGQVCIALATTAAIMSVAHPAAPLRDCTIPADGERPRGRDGGGRDRGSPGCHQASVIGHETWSSV